MEDFIFCEGPAPAGFKIDYEIFLFNLPEHRLIQSPKDWISYYILEKRKKVILAEIHFHVADRIASSPCRSPFGSLEASVKTKPVTLFRFLEYVNSSLAEKGIHQVIIKAPPTIYHNEIQILMHTFLLNLKYQISKAETTAVLLTDKPFEELSQKWEKRKVRQAMDKNLSLRYHDIGDLQTVYDFIFACREKKGYASSMTFAEIERVGNSFPDRFLLTSVWQGDKMVAASISIQINRRILYHFYSDHIRPITDINPTVFLIKGLYEYALKNKIQLLDLGTSSLDGYPNFGLLDFKVGLGATLASKFTFEKILME